MVEQGLAEEGSPEALYLQPFSMLEAKLKVQRLNSENNKKELKALDENEKLPWMKTYLASSRHLFRNCWFTKFLNVLITKIVNDRECKMSLAG